MVDIGNPTRVSLIPKLPVEKQGATRIDSPAMLCPSLLPATCCDSNIKVSIIGITATTAKNVLI
jgi:hypothetical protein